MHLHVHRTLLLLLGIFSALSYAGCSGYFKREVDDSPWIGRRGLNLVKRDARSKRGKTVGVAPIVDNPVCGGCPSDYTPPKSRRKILPKRELTPFPQHDHKSLAQRILTEFPTDQDARDTFMVEQVLAADADVVPDPYQNDDEFDDINSGLYREIGDALVSLGLGAKEGDDGDPIRLTGCTALIVMSEKVVRYAHFWETLASGGPDEVFQSHVIKFINNGGTQNPDEQQSPAAYADSFRDQPGAPA